MTTRFVVFDLRSGVQLGEVPLGSVSYTQRLNADYELSGRVDLAERLSDGTSLGSYYRDLLKPGKTKLAAVPEATTAAGVAEDPISFVVWDRDYDGERFLTIRCAGIWSYIAQYPLTVRKAYSSEDQHNIASDLIMWVQAQPSSDIQLRLDPADSGVRRDAYYEGFERRPIGELVSELAASDNGFEYSIQSSGGVRAVIDTWTAHYPQQGTLYADSPKTIQFGRLPATLKLSEKAPVTTLTLVGAGEGDDMAFGSATAWSLLSDGYPALPATMSYKTAATTNMLNARVLGELLQTLRRRKTWTVTARRDIDRYEWSEIGVGDEVVIRIDPGVDLLYPEGLTLLQRVIGRTVTLGDNGDDSLTFELGDATSSIPDEPVGVITYRVVGTGDSILAMSWGMSSPGGVIQTPDRWLDFEHGRNPYTVGLAFRYSTAGIWPLLESASQPEGWVIIQDNSLGTDDAGWTTLMTTILNDLQPNRNLVAVLPGYLASVDATISAAIARRAVIMQSVFSANPRAHFVDLAAYMVANPTQFPDGQHPNATAQVWIRGQIEGLTG